jgi:hypothetical protein
METLSIYNCKLIYVKGQNNTMADALSCYPTLDTQCDVTAEKTAQHPHIKSNSNNNHNTILNRSLTLHTPLTSIAALTNINPQKNKNRILN